MMVRILYFVSTDLFHQELEFQPFWNWSHKRGPPCYRRSHRRKEGVSVVVPKNSLSGGNRKYHVLFSGICAHILTARLKLRTAMNIIFILQ